MFDVGFTELLLIGVVSLVVIGPERLPDVARTVGHWIAKVQRFVRGVKQDINKELETGDLKQLIGDQRKQIDELRGLVDTTRRDFESSTRQVVSGAKKTLGELEASVREDDDTTTEPDATRDGSTRSLAAEPADALPASGAPQTSDDPAADSANSGRSEHPGESSTSSAERR